MPEQKISIANRTNKRIVVVVDHNDSDKGLAFVMHGLSGSKDQHHIVAFSQALKEHQLTVVRFDTRNTFGESEGLYEDANITNYLEDLEDVIAWATSQPWYREPFYLVGHSLGGICTLLYAQHHPHEVKAIAPISSVISGNLQISHNSPEDRKRYEETGWKEVPSVSQPSLMRRLKWHQYVADATRHDTLPLASKLTMPVFLLTGSEDKKAPESEQRMLFDVLPGRKELHIIEGAPHTFRDPHHLAQIKTFLSAWVGNVESGALRTHL